MTVPIGIQEAIAYPAVAIVEGGPNALAVLAQAWASSVEDRVAPICMPSSSANFSVSEAGYLKDKRCRIFADNDRPGWDAMMRWAAQLAQYAKVDGFDFSVLGIKDINDVCLIDAECWERNRETIEGMMDFATERIA
jgi:hypothetical protein